jgi:hypothetical protein
VVGALKWLCIQLPDPETENLVYWLPAFSVKDYCLDKSEHVERFKVKAFHTRLRNVRLWGLVMQMGGPINIVDADIDWVLAVPDSEPIIVVLDHSPVMECKTDAVTEIKSLQFGIAFPNPQVLIVVFEY